MHLGFERVARSRAVAALRAVSALRGVLVGCWADRARVSRAAGRASEAMSSDLAALISVIADLSFWNSGERMRVESWVRVQWWRSQRSRAESVPSRRSRVSWALRGSGMLLLVDSLFICMRELCAMKMGGTRVGLQGRRVCALVAGFHAGFMLRGSHWSSEGSLVWI